ncbi:MAG: DUF4190 domain-containing protein [Acidimicrobiales bacterium]
MEEQPPPGWGPPSGQPAQWGPPGQWAAPPPAASASTNGLAIAAFVCALCFFWVLGIGSLLGVVLGFVALSQIRKRGQRGRGLAVAGIILGFLGLAIGILLLAAGAAFFGEFKEEVGADLPASLSIEASADTCWEATLITGARVSSGEAETPETGCGPSTFDLGQGLLRLGEVRHVSGSEPLTVVVEVDGQERSRQSIKDGKVAVSTFDSRFDDGP